MHNLSIETLDRLSWSQLGRVLDKPFVNASPQNSAFEFKFEFKILILRLFYFLRTHTEFSSTLGYICSRLTLLMSFVMWTHSEHSRPDSSLARRANLNSTEHIGPQTSSRVQKNVWIQLKFYQVLQTFRTWTLPEKCVWWSGKRLEAQGPRREIQPVFLGAG